MKVNVEPQPRPASLLQREAVEAQVRLRANAGPVGYILGEGDDVLVRRRRGRASRECSSASIYSSITNGGDGWQWGKVLTVMGIGYVADTGSASSSCLSYLVRLERERQTDRDRDRQTDKQTDRLVRLDYDAETGREATSTDTNDDEQEWVVSAADICVPLAPLLRRAECHATSHSRERAREREEEREREEGREKKKEEKRLSDEEKDKQLAGLRR